MIIIPLIRLIRKWMKRRKAAQQQHRSGEARR
jgi:hypothetical protein